MSKSIRIGTRGSKLALWQANFVKDSLQKIFPDLKININVIKTSGDRFYDKSLSQIGGKGLFIKEIEEAILGNEVDIAVHSMKDVPVDLPEGLEISVFSEREDARDILISRDNLSFNDLEREAVVGTGSLRRQVQIKRLRVDLRLKELRGNVDTRLKKLADGEYDAIVLASAGVRRLGLENQITQHFSTDEMIPSPGQGIIGIECRVDDEETKMMIGKLNDKSSEISIQAERNFVNILGGDCSLPLGCYCEFKSDSNIDITGFVASVDGKKIVKDRVAGISSQNIELSNKLAENILSRGGKEIIYSFS